MVVHIIEVVGRAAAKVFIQELQEGQPVGEVDEIQQGLDVLSIKIFNDEEFGNPGASFYPFRLRRAGKIGQLVRIRGKVWSPAVEESDDVDLSLTEKLEMRGNSDMRLFTQIHTLASSGTL